MTDPRGGQGPRGDERGGERRSSQPVGRQTAAIDRRSAKLGAVPAEPAVRSGGAGRRTREIAREREPVAPPTSWMVTYAERIRWTTWIAVALIVLRLVVPRPDGWRRWSDAEAALNDAEAARTAALLSYQAADKTWPPPGRIGVAPANMLPYLPGEASFSRARYRLAWEYAADTSTGARVIGISVTGTDPQLPFAMAKRAPEGLPYIISGDRFTVLIASAAGR